MARKFLFLSLVLALFSIQATGQNRIIIQIPANQTASDALALAAEKGGYVVDFIPGANQFLLDLPTVPIRLWDNDIRWMELLIHTTLQSTPYAKYLQMSQTPAPIWYQTQPSFQLVHLPGALGYSTGATVIVADINSLVDQSHPDLQNHLTAGYDFVANKPGGS